jgi:hypothetical protein
MTNILGDEKRQDVLALGRLGWTLRRIQKATGVRREDNRKRDSSDSVNNVQPIDLLHTQSKN